MKDNRLKFIKGVVIFMEKTITQVEYERLLAKATKVYKAEQRALDRWYEKYVEYYAGERAELYKQYCNSLHNTYNRVVDDLQEMLIPVNAR